MAETLVRAVQATIAIIAKVTAKPQDTRILTAKAGRHRTSYGFPGNDIVQSVGVSVRYWRMVRPP